MTAIPNTYPATALAPYGNRAVAINGDSPPATTEASCAPSDAPLYRTPAPNISERNAACGPYIGASAKTITTVNAAQISATEWVSISQKNGNAHSAIATAPDR